MKIYFNGDSNVAGTELRRPEVEGFAAKLANKLGATSIHNGATHSASNWRIFQTTREYLQQCNGNYPDFMVIGWTEGFREEWFYNGEYRSSQGPGCELVTIRETPEWKHWRKQMAEDYRYKREMCKFYNRTIYNLHCELKHLKINHLFFNAIDSLASYEPEEEHEKVFRFDWGVNYFEPYTHNMNWRVWAENRGYEQISPGWYHYTEPCQEAWSDVIFNYIKESKLL